jgi:acetoin utilization deacetylase AcuC-like enzyme
MLFVGPGFIVPISIPSARARARGAGGTAAAVTAAQATQGYRAGVDRPVHMPTVWSPRHTGHTPGGGYWLGVELPDDDEPSRGEILRGALERAGAPVHVAVAHGDEPVLAVHDGEFLDWMSRAWDEWEAAGLVEETGQRRVVPYVFARPQLTSGRPIPEPAAAWARSGRFALDTMTLISPGTYDAARGAVDAALTACDLVVDRGHRAAYAACRPPGHHAGAALYGGSCYLNNAACAAQYLRDRGVARVAVVDIDAHHGNGTQEIFYARGDVFFGSVHVDPGAGWFPHFLGFADERGTDDGAGANRNIPLPAGAGDEEWMTAVSDVVEDARRSGPTALVVSLGVDAAAGDPESPLQVTENGFGRAGRALAGLGVPTVFVQEGGYDLARLGDLVLAVLGGFED